MAFIGCRVNHREWPEETLDFLFGIADCPKLRAAGDPLPDPGPLLLYRGVAGTGKARRLRGYSWTGSLDIACWFATRLDLPSPAVFTASIQAEEVLAYHDGRSEQEFICRPKRVTRMKMGLDEISERAKRHAEWTRAQSEAMLAEFIARKKDPSNFR
jgi:hypothetical protein